MSAICIIDTSVFCNILNVPNRNQQHTDAMGILRQYVAERLILLLPMTTIYETGNHIAQNGDGRARRQTAELFIEQVSLAINGNAPWTPTPMPDAMEMLSWLNQFPDSAMRGVSFGDLAIIRIYERTCQLHQGHRVFIWSYDGDLQGYDRPPTI